MAIRNASYNQATRDLKDRFGVVLHKAEALTKFYSRTYHDIDSLENDKWNEPPNLEERVNNILSDTKVVEILCQNSVPDLAGYKKRLFYSLERNDTPHWIRKDNFDAELKVIKSELAQKNKST